MTMAGPRLAGVAAFLTGGGSGIGRAVCERFAREGARVAVADIAPERAGETVARIAAAGGEALAVECDVADAGAVVAAVAQTNAAFGGIDLLVNNAGFSVGDDILAIDEATWDLNLGVVLKGAYLCSRAVLPRMIDRRRGAIVNVASVNGLLGLGEDAYSAAKAGVISLTRNLAVRYGPAGVRVNCVCPATVRTPAWQPLLDRDPGVLDRVAGWYPLRRVGEPADVASAVLFLASDEAAWITGQTLVVDGGLTAGNEGLGRETAASAVAAEPVL